MSQAPDKDSKTEEPTEKKIADAVEKGNVPRSREMAVFASLLGVLAASAFLVGPGAISLSSQMIVLMDDPGAFALESGHEANQLLWAVSLEVGQFLLPVVLLLAAAGMAAALFQNAPNFALEQIRPKWSRVSLSAGWQRIFGTQGFVEFLKSLFKFGTIAIVCLIILNADRDGVINAMLGDPAALPALALSLAVRLLSAVCVTIAILVAADIVWTRFRWRADLRMTRQELKDELKQSEGDPLVKGRLRSLARDRARRRMIAAVPQATVVIANPTHYAIALKYDRTKGGAPLVIAKGVDLIALRIREIANRHAIPIVEDKPLARAMYDAVEVDQWIPPEFYRAVAKILHFLYSRPAHVPIR
jgi:flagellar biosynthetic protein FlhB